MTQFWGHFFVFFGPKWIIFGLGIRLEKYLGVHSLIHTNNFCLPFSCSICNLNFSMDGQTDKITYRSCPQSLENHVITMLQESTRNRLSIRLNMYVWIRFICDAWFGSNTNAFVLEQYWRLFDLAWITYIAVCPSVGLSVGWVIFFTIVKKISKIGFMSECS